MSRLETNIGARAARASAAAAILAVASVGLSPAAAETPVRIISGGSGAMKWKAETRIIGQNSTGGREGGGNPLYFATQPQKSGVVTLIMDYGAGGRFICSGSLASDRRSVVTAGHCVSGGFGTANPLKTTVYFNNGSNPDSRVFQDPTSTAIDVTAYYVNPLYTGEVIDQNDVAVLRLQHAAPAYATSYEIFSEGDLTGSGFNVAGYGGRSDVGGAVGTNARTGYLREGDNVFDFRLGDEVFGGIFNAIFEGEADYDFSYVSDFDNGTNANDASCIVAAAVGVAGGAFCSTGLGAREVNIAGGDSGGPGFIDGKLASVNSYGLTFGSEFGDFDDDLNSSWGEFSGYVPLFLHKDFIEASFVPEPATWMFMVAGFGLVGTAIRRRRPVAATG